MASTARRTTRAGIALAMLLAALATLLAAPGPSAARDAATIEVTPQVYVAGQAMHFTGSLGRTGRHPLRLQFNMNRPGDVWVDVAGFRATSDAAGRFDFTWPAPAMFNISYRVTGGGAATRPWLFHARSQEALLSVDMLGLQTPLETIVSGKPFVVDVDTAPVVPGRGDLPPPVLAGREVELQQRVGTSTWKTLATGRTDDRGHARFRFAGITLGPLVLRAKLDDWTRGGDRVGWFASFPTYWSVLTGAQNRRALRTAPATYPGVSARSASTTTPGPVSPRAGATTNASTRFGWGPSRYDFAWEYGESLSSRAARGTDTAGSWADVSTGTGRASHFNGGLALESQFGNHGGPGDHGDVTATLRGNSQTYGRWEFRRRSWALESRSPDFALRIDLVPDSLGTRSACGGPSVNVAEVTVHGTTLTLGATSGDGRQTWGRTVRGVRLGDLQHNFAVEVARDHITWFLDAKVIATTKNRAAVPGVPLTPRVSMLGDGQREMNQTKAIYDWVRAWPIGTGQHPTDGPGLKQTTLTC